MAKGASARKEECIRKHKRVTKRAPNKEKVHIQATREFFLLTGFTLRRRMFPL